MTETIQDFNIDMEFFLNIQELSDSSIKDLYEQLSNIYPLLPKDDIYTRGISGVLREDEVFFELEFINVNGEPPVFLDIKYTDIDNYLDAVNQKQTIEQLLQNEKN